MKKDQSVSKKNFRSLSEGKKEKEVVLVEAEKTLPRKS